MRTAEDVLDHLSNCLQEASSKLTSSKMVQGGLRLLFEDGSQWYLRTPLQIKEADGVEDDDDLEDDDLEEDEESDSFNDDDFPY